MRAWEEPDTTCAGCGGHVPGPEVGVVWIRSTLGLSTARTHRTKECAAAAVANCPEQPAKRIRRPLSKLERDAEKAAAGGR